MYIRICIDFEVTALPSFHLLCSFSNTDLCLFSSSAAMLCLESPSLYHSSKVAFRWNHLIWFFSLRYNSSVLSVTQFLKTVVVCILFRFFVGEARRVALEWGPTFNVATCTVPLIVIFKDSVKRYIGPFNPPNELFSTVLHQNCFRLI